ncbi:MAG TPA: DUF1667 domain-containing protein [Candidatus Omnitrophota bacterium]|nr:DUF1667 domain-containing protein [Candidatus Omnitrophota bacterium]HPS19591.1 DUF1667 domain-containing protein [Candidatus Omnitrophota bacterium]
MTKQTMICIECPRGCVLKVDAENGRVVKVEGNGCPKGSKYAVSEVEAPARVLTSAVIAEGLSLRMLPVRTDKPVPKTRIMEAMEEVKKIIISEPIRCGDIVKKNILGLGVNLIATRDFDRE